MKIRPLQDRIIIAREKGSTRTEGGLYIPEQAQEKMLHGEVLDVGPDVKDIEAGNVAIFTKYCGTEHEFNGQELLIVRADDVLGVVER